MKHSLAALFLLGWFFILFSPDGAVQVGPFHDSGACSVIRQTLTQYPDYSASICYDSDGTPFVP